MRWDWELTRTAQKQMERLDRSVQRRIVEALSKLVEALSADNEPANVKRLVGVGDDFRLRVGDYRVIFRYERREVAEDGAPPGLPVEVIGVAAVQRIGHRGDVYRG